MSAVKQWLIEQETGDPEPGPATDFAIALEGKRVLLFQAKHHAANHSENPSSEMRDMARRSLTAYLHPLPRDPAPENQNCGWQVSDRNARTSSVLFERLVDDLAYHLLKTSVTPPAPTVEPEPITIDRLAELAKQVGYTEVYLAFRHRDPKRLDPDRLSDSFAMAPSLDVACAKLILLAGFDEEAKEHGLDQFDPSTVFELCDRLKELTGDTFEVSPYETPSEPKA